MKKKVNLIHFIREMIGRTTKILILIMVMIMLNFTSRGAISFQGNQIAINEDCINLEDLIWKIKETTGYKFVYNTKHLADYQKLKINERGELEEVLEAILKDTDLTYGISGGAYVIKKKEPVRVKQEQKVNNKVTGKVTDKDGVPLPGVSVYIKGTAVGASTNKDGEYVIKVGKNTKVLIYSFVGMQSQEIRYNQQSSINVVLEDSKQSIGEVVVTGYQQIDKRKLSSAVATIKSEELLENNTLSVDQMLQGKVAGLTVQGNSSTPGVAQRIRIRGASSISGSREPIWVVDGVVLQETVNVSAEQLNSFDNVNFIGNAIQSINPEDIDRIDVLKDASATAIYGSKAANGVIVISTKKGKIGKPNFNFSATFSYGEREHYGNLNLMNSKERIDVSKELAERGFSQSPNSVLLGYEALRSDLFGRKISIDEYHTEVARLETLNTDWFDILYRNPFSQDYNFSVSGGSDSADYYFSLGYTDSKASLLNSGLDQVNMLGKLNFKLSRKLNVGIQLRNFVSNKDYQHSSVFPYTYAMNTSRAIDAYDENGDYLYYTKSENAGISLDYNILNELDNSGKKIETNRTDFLLNADYKISNQFKYSVLGSYSRGNVNQEEWATEQSYYVAALRGVNFGESFRDYSDKEQVLIDASKLPVGGELSELNSRSDSYTFRNSLNFSNTFEEKHFLDVTVGLEVNSNKNKGFDVLSRGYLHKHGKKYASIDPAEYKAYSEWLRDYRPTITDAKSNSLSYYGIITYAYDDKYILNFNIREDGSNQFGQNDNNRFNAIWSSSVRWNMHEESFLENLRWLNMLALRGSYGIQGNALPSSPSLISRADGVNSVSGEYQSSLVNLANPNLTWEKTISYNVGVDFMILGGRLSGSLEHYYKKGEDLIINKQVSVVTGVSSLDINKGDMFNKGFEGSLRAKLVSTKDLGVNLNLNFYKNINEVTKSGLKDDFNYQDYLNGSLVVEGKPIGGFYSYQFAGLDGNGLPTFENIEETEGATAKQMYEKVFEYSGSLNPDISGGIALGLRYKNWALNCSFTYSLGSHVRLPRLYGKFGQSVPTPDQNMSAELVNRWRKPGDEAFTDIPSLSDQQLLVTPQRTSRTILIANNMWEMYNMSNVRVVPGDFLRLNNLSISYDFPKSICERLKVKGISAQLTGSNLFLWADDRLNGRDPEHMGLGRGTTPPLRNFTAKVNINF